MRDDRHEVAGLLLEWYDSHARKLPWRVSPQDRAAGVVPDPYRVWLSEIMLQQTTVAAVERYFLRFTELWPDVTALAGAEDGTVMAEWAGLGYYARARNLLKCARVVSAELDGRFPGDAPALMTLPGIGPYTAAAIAAIAFDRPEPVVDGNVERVMARFFAETEPLPDVKGALRDHAARLTPESRPGDYAQAVMDLGATICTPRSPACGICPLTQGCAGRAEGIAATLPRKRPKAAKPVRRGTVFVGRRADGAWLLERRPDKGLLGGMLGWPGSDWAETPVAAEAPVPANWRDCGGGEVRHTFTHFHLILRVMVADLTDGAAPEGAVFIPAEAFDPSHLPTVMKKAHALAQNGGPVSRGVQQAEEAD